MKRQGLGFLCPLSCGLLLMSAVTPVIAGEVQPFALYNQSPVLHIYGLPLPRGFRTLPEGDQSFELSLDLTNNFEAQAEPGETAIFDGETHRWTFSYRRGFADGLEFALELPYVRHTGGQLDSFIDDFHDVFGFGSGGRDRVPEDQLVYSVVRNGVTRVSVIDSSGGVGDVRLSLSRPLNGVSDGYGASAGVTLKLPTGDARELTGSESADLAVWATYGSDNTSSPWGFVGTIGAIYTGEGEVLPELRRNGGVFGSLTVGYAWNEQLQLKAQLYANSPLYDDTELDVLDSASALGVLGGSWQFAPGWGLDVGVVEDLHVGASPDVSFHFALRRKI